MVCCSIFFSSVSTFFCENPEERRRGRKKDLRKKKAFAFFYIKILSSFFPLFSFIPQKSAVLPIIFMSGLRLKYHGHLLAALRVIPRSRFFN